MYTHTQVAIYIQQMIAGLLTKEREREKPSHLKGRGDVFARSKGKGFLEAGREGEKGFSAGK